MFRNRWPECSGMGGRNGAELVAGIKRNMHGCFIEAITYKKLLSFIDHLLDKLPQPKVIICYLDIIRGFSDHLIHE